MNILKKNRRHFLKNSLATVAGLSAYSMLSSCSSFDDYLFEDRYAFNDEIMIVGGGVAGLYLAHKLRSYKTEFRLFEGSTSFGGRLRSASGVDYGASLLSNKDLLAGKLVQELGLTKKSADKDFYYLAEGMQAVPDVLVERIMGLIPYRNFRLRWKLVEIEKLSSGYELLFEHPNGQKRFKCRKVALAIPPSQWGSVKGLLSLPEMAWAQDWLKTLQVDNTIKLVVPATALPNLSKSIVESSFENLKIRQLVKRNKATPFVEIDISYLLNSDISIDYIYGSLRRKLQLNYPVQKLGSEQFFDWQQLKLIKGAHFTNSLAVPMPSSSNFQILGDFTSLNGADTVEGALQSAQRASELFL